LKASRRAFTIEPEQSLEEKLAALIAIRSVGADPACLIDLCEDGDWVVERIPTADAAAQYPRYPRSMGTRKAGIILLAVTLLGNLGCGASRPAAFWTVSQVESIKRVRGTALETTTCRRALATAPMARSRGYREQATDDLPFLSVIPWTLRP
jgi:hypothetical protein